MKATVYLRVAETSRGFKYVATAKPSDQPIYNGTAPLPTIAFAIVLNIAQHAFEIPVIGEINVPLDAISPCVEVEP